MTPSSTQPSATTHHARPRTRAAITCLAAIAAAASITSAQVQIGGPQDSAAAPSTIKLPPRVEMPEQHNGIVMVLIVLVAAAATAGAAIIPSQRTHQD